MSPVVKNAQPLVQGIFAYDLPFWMNVDEDRGTLGHIPVRGEPPVVFKTSTMTPTFTS